MPILVPQSALDKALAEDKKRRGILDAMPDGGFTHADLEQRGMSYEQARLWTKKNAIRVGMLDRNIVYKLRDKNARRI
jgi:hypothetical protein